MEPCNANRKCVGEDGRDEELADKEEEPYLFTCQGSNQAVTNAPDGTSINLHTWRCLDEPSNSTHESF